MTRSDIILKLFATELCALTLHIALSFDSTVHEASQCSRIMAKIHFTVSHSWASFYRHFEFYMCVVRTPARSNKLFTFLLLFVVVVCLRLVQLLLQRRRIVANKSFSPASSLNVRSHPEYSTILFLR